MAKRKKLNTNLVAFITIVGVVFTVSVVTLVTWQATQRDPEVLAENAREREEAGDLQKAASFYHRAYTASDETDLSYLLEEVRCWFGMGELGAWLDRLTKARSKHSRDTRLVETILDGLWRIRQIRGQLIWPERWRDNGVAMLALDTSEDPLDQDARVRGAACLAQGLWALGADLSGATDSDTRRVAETYGSTGDEVALSAYELSPTHPWAVLTWAQYESRQMADQINRARLGGVPSAQIEALRQGLLDEVRQGLKQALVEHPSNSSLVVTLSGFMNEEYQRLLAADQVEQAHEVFDQGTEILDQAIAGAPEAPELREAAARHWSLRLVNERQQMSPEEQNEIRVQARQHAEEAVRLEPAMYEAYALLANLELTQADDAAADPDGRRGHVEAALAIYEKAARDTVMLRNVTAVLTGQNRPRMLLQAFTVALRYYLNRPHEEDSEEILKRAEGFLADAETKYPDAAITCWMRGELAAARGDTTSAIQAFEQANQKRPRPAFWTDYCRLDALPSERLALLYLDYGQVGEAGRYAELARTQYEHELSQTPPVMLIVTSTDILMRLRQSQEALDLLDRYLQVVPDNRSLLAARAAVLGRMGRGGEATDTLGKFTPSEIEARLWRARVAVGQREFDTAEHDLQSVIDDAEATADQVGEARELLVTTMLGRARQFAQQEQYGEAEAQLRPVLNDAHATDGQLREALDVYVRVMSLTERREEALAYVRELAENPPREGMVRMLRTYEVILSEQDQEKRDEKILEVIAQGDDPLTRAREYYSFYASRDDLEKAVTYLPEIRRLQTDEDGQKRVLEEEFRLRLHLGQFDQAAELIVSLSQYRDGQGFDRVGGATYRGELALARGGRDNAEKAVQEFRRALLALPRSAELEIWLARALMMAGRTQEAVEALRRATELNPRSFQAQYLLMLACRQRATELFGDEQAQYEEEARQALERMSALNPEHPAVMAAQAEQEVNADPAAALATFREQWQKNPTAENALRVAQSYPGAWLAQADKPAVAAALTEEAGQFYASAREQLSGVDLLQLMQLAGRFYAVSGNAGVGEALLKDFITQQTGRDHVRAELLLGMFYEEVEEYDAAEQAYQAAQQYVLQEIEDPQTRRELDQQVGVGLIEFFQRRRIPSQVVEVCRWMLDRMDPEEDITQVVRGKLIAALLEAGQLGDAEVEVRDYINDYPDDVDGLVARAQLHLDRNERMAALADLTEVLQANPQHLWARYRRGAIELQRGQFDRAREDLTMAVKLASESRLKLLVRDLLARLYERTDQVDLAERELRAMLDMLDQTGGGADRKQQLSSRLVRLLYGRAQEFGRAQELISEYMEKEPNEPIWPLEMGQLLEARAGEAEANGRDDEARQDYSTAATYYERASGRRGATPRLITVARQRRLGALVKAERAQEAVQLFESLPATTLTAGLRVAVAPAYDDLGNRSIADQQWRMALLEAIGQSSSSGGVVAREMRTKVTSERAEQVLRALQDELPAGSEVGLRIRVLLAGHLARTGQSADALALLNDILGQLPAGSDDRLDALLMRAQALDQTGDERGAVEVYRQVLSEYPDNLTAMNNLAYSLVDENSTMHRPQEALEYAERLWKLVAGDSGAATVLDTVGWVYFRNNDYELAEAALSEALAVDQDLLAAHLHLGQVFEAAGRRADARRAYERGITAGTRGGVPQSDEILQEIRTRLEALR